MRVLLVNGLRSVFPFKADSTSCTYSVLPHPLYYVTREQTKPSPDASNIPLDILPSQTVS